MKTKAFFRRFNTVFLPAILIFAGFSSALAKYSGGTGEPNDPYLIATPNDLNSIGLDPCDWDKHFKMTADINMAEITGDSFNIVGNFDAPFVGTFDGNGFTISNFTYNTESEISGISVFGLTNSNALIQQVTLINSDVNAPESFWVGALIGRANNGQIISCTVLDSVIAGYGSVGGLEQFKFDCSHIHMTQTILLHRWQ